MISKQLTVERKGDKEMSQRDEEEGREAEEGHRERRERERWKEKRMKDGRNERGENRPIEVSIKKNYKLVIKSSIRSVGEVQIHV